eukprot:128505_1
MRQRFHFAYQIMFLVLSITSAMHAFVQYDIQQTYTDLSVKILPNSEYSQCLNFLMDNMPPRDIGNIPDEVLNLTINYALLTRNIEPYNKYSSYIPFDIFKNYVLPYATLSEARENWRKYFFDFLTPYIVNMTLGNPKLNSIDIFLWFINNQNNLFNIQFKSGSTPSSYSPFEVLSYGYGSCTGYSLFVTAALRSIGIPTRVVGTPQWVSNCTGTPGNHNWIEIYDQNGYWSFMDAVNLEGYTTINTSWFYPNWTNCQIPGSLNHSIYASSFAPTDNKTYFVMEWEYDAKYVPAYDVTNNYQTN